MHFHSAYKLWRNEANQKVYSNLYVIDHSDMENKE
jgi:hypothetical protein